MATTPSKNTREQRLAEKLRENLKRRKSQSRARAGTERTAQTPAEIRNSGPDRGSDQ